MEKEKILVVVHPFWTNYTRNKHYVDSLLDYSNEFGYTMILLPRLSKGVKRRLLRAALRKITTTEQMTVDGVFLSHIKNLFNNPDKLFGIYGSTSKYNSNSTYPVRLKTTHVS